VEDALGVRFLRILGLTARDLVAIQRNKVDVFEVQRREATVAGHIADNAAQEREDHARAFNQQKRVHLVFGHVFNVEDTDIVDFQQEQRRVAAFGF